VTNSRGSLRRAARLVLPGVAFVSLTACRVDLATTINVAENGSGAITVVAKADAAALRAAPELPEALNLDDLRAAGWEVTVQDPTVQDPTTDGSLSVTARREFATVDEATMFLSQLSGENGPLREMSIVRTGGVNDSTYTFSAQGGLRDGLAGFADAEALVSLGGAPFAESLAARGMTLADVLGMSLSLTMPGEPVDTNGTAAARTDDDLTTTITWTIPVDVADAPLAATTRARDVSALVSGVIARVFLIAMILFIAAVFVYVATVIQRRSRSAPGS